MIKAYKLITVLFLTVLLATLFPVHAADDYLKVEVKAEIVNGGYMELEGTDYLPEQTEIKDSGKYIFDFSDAQPGSRYTYTIRQTKMIDPNMNYDMSIYTLTVDIVYEEEHKYRYAVAVLHKGDEETKPAEILFNNSPKGRVYVVYIDIETGKEIKILADACPECVIGDYYRTLQLDFDEYEFVQMSDDSAPTEGSVQDGEQTVKYMYRKIKKGNVIVIYRDASTGKELKEKETVCPVCREGTEYKTSPAKIEGYNYKGLAKESAPEKGKVKEGDTLVIYEYTKKEYDDYRPAPTGIDGIVEMISGKNIL